MARYRRFVACGNPIAGAPAGAGPAHREGDFPHHGANHGPRAIEKRRADNFHVRAHGINADGQVKASVRDDRSSEVNYEVSRRKAYTALAYRRPSADMEKAWATMFPSRITEGTFGAAGGLPVKVGNDTIGVGGAPGGDNDEACAAAGLAKASDKLK